MYDLDELNKIVRSLPLRRIDVSKYIGIRRQTLWEKLQGGSSFTAEEVAKIYELKEKYKV